MEAYDSVVDGLRMLHKHLTLNKRDWQEMDAAFVTAYEFNLLAAQILDWKMQVDSPHHSLWTFGYNAVVPNDSFSAAFWIMTFNHLANQFDVPMSWMAALRFTENNTPDSPRRWDLKECPSFVDQDGFCNESLYAAHLDGIRTGLIRNEEFQFERRPEAEESSVMMMEAVEKIASEQGISLREFLEAKRSQNPTQQTSGVEK